jgi:hypothetical protein
MKDATISTMCLPDLICCPSPGVLRGRPGAEAGANTSGIDGLGVNAGPLRPPASRLDRDQFGAFFAMRPKGLGRPAGSAKSLHAGPF